MLGVWERLVTHCIEIRSTAETLPDGLGQGITPSKGIKNRLKLSSQGLVLDYSDLNIKKVEVTHPQGPLYLESCQVPCSTNSLAGPMISPLTSCLDIYPDVPFYTPIVQL